MDDVQHTENHEVQGSPGQAGVEQVSPEPLTNLGTLFSPLSAGWGGLWKALTVISLLLNVGLMLVVFALGQRFFAFKAQVADPLVGSLERAVSSLEGASMRTQVVIQEEIPVAFDLSVNQETVVTLARPVRVEGAHISIQTVGLSINAPAVVELPAGTQLPLTMELSAPVELRVPLNLSVPVEIALAQSELYPVLKELQSSVRPSAEALDASPDCWQMLLWGGACR
jgi:hypothetical protein